MAEYRYTQFKKNYVRHSSIQHAVSILTTRRQDAPCVSREYVRKVYDYFTQSEDESRNKTEALKINRNYILDWEYLHDSFCRPKAARELTICYLCGPEPNNDFDEFVSLGVLPQNIWAFEYDKKMYEKALSVYDDECYRQPRIIKQNIETFFQQTPKKFDIIYIDACGSIPSTQHALRCIATAFQFHRLESPGIVISNFAEPEDPTNFIELIAQFLFSKDNKPYSFSNEGHISSEEYATLKKKVEADFSAYYGDFISLVLRDLPSIYIPLQRFWKNPFSTQIVQSSHSREMTAEEINNVSSASSRFFLAYDMQRCSKPNTKIETFRNEIGDHASLLFAIKQFKSSSIEYAESLKAIDDFFSDKTKVHQFLDKPHSNLLLDVLINQLAYPFHSNTKQNLRYRYKAKSTQMYTDVSVYDECRYIYDWLPAVNQIQKAFSDLSYQYVFRFALDGLVKTRQHYNNEFFYQGSVVSDDIDVFQPHLLPQRIDI